MAYADREFFGCAGPIVTSGKWLKRNLDFWSYLVLRKEVVDGCKR